MTVISDILSLLRVHEGCSLTAYWDRTGHVWTIGFGYAGPDVHDGLVWTPEEAEDHLELAEQVAASDAAHLVGQTWDQIDPFRQMGLIDMSYNLGYPKMSQFDDFLMYIRQAQWSDAVNDLAHTAWASELPNRCRDDSQLLLTGAPINV